MHRVVLHDITEAAAGTLNVPPRFSVLAITHKIGNLPGYTVDTDDGLQYVSCHQDVCCIFHQLAEPNQKGRGANAAQHHRPYFLYSNHGTHLTLHII